MRSYPDALHLTGKTDEAELFWLNGRRWVGCCFLVFLLLAAPLLLENPGLGKHSVETTMFHHSLPLWLTCFPRLGNETAAGTASMLSCRENDV